MAAGLGAAADALAEAWRYLAPEADEPLRSRLRARYGLQIQEPPLRREGPDGSLRCAAVRAVAAAAGAPPRPTPEWGVDDGYVRAPEIAAGAGQLGLLRALPADREWDWAVRLAAASRGDVAALAHIQALVPRSSADLWIVRAAAEGGHVGAIQWLRAQEPPYPWGTHICSAAASGGHVGALVWLRAQNPPCPWDEWVCAAAAASGRLEVLVWLRTQMPPCPWDRGSCLRNARGEVREWIEAQPP